MLKTKLHIKHKWTILVSLTLSMVFNTLNLLAQDPNFIATANRSEVALNQTIQVTYTFNNVNDEAFRPPNFDPFTSYGQSTSSSWNFINGKQTQSKSYIFTLKPTKEGSFEIPAATAKINGKNVKSNPVNITVVAASSPSTNPNNPGSNPNSNINPKTSIEQQIKENLFVRVVPSSNSVYQGEQISLTYKLLFRVNLQDISITKAPSYDGFLSHEIELSEASSQRQVETYKDMQFNSSLFKQYAIFPTNPGTFSLDPMEVESIVAVEIQTRSFFPQYEQYKNKTLSNPVTITVKPLPKDNQPADFTGVVGREFQFSVDYDKTETKVNDPITLKIKVTGKGNIKLIDIPEFEFPQSFEVYDPEIKEAISTKSFPIGGSKSYEYLIVPRGGGEFQFPDISFSYFDLDSKKYISKVVEGPLIKVEGDQMADNNTMGMPSREAVELLGEDIKFIKTAPITLSEKSTKNILVRPIFHFFTWLPIGLAFFIPFLYKRKKDNNKDTVHTKSKKARKEAVKRLTLAKKLLSGSDDKAYYNEIVKSVWGYLTDKFNISSADISKEIVLQVLTDKGVSSNLIDDTSSLIDNCEMAIYAPSAINESKNSILTKAEFLIENLEKEIGNL